MHAQQAPLKFYKHQKYEEQTPEAMDGGALFDIGWYIVVVVVLMNL